METTRHKRIHHGASILRIGKSCTLRLNASDPYKTEVSGIYEKLKREVEVVKVAEHKALYKFKK